MHFSHPDKNTKFVLVEFEDGTRENLVYCGRKEPKPAREYVQVVNGRRKSFWVLNPSKEQVRSKLKTQKCKALAFCYSLGDLEIFRYNLKNRENGIDVQIGVMTVEQARKNGYYDYSPSSVVCEEPRTFTEPDPRLRHQLEPWEGQPNTYWRKCQKCGYSFVWITQGKSSYWLCHPPGVIEARRWNGDSCDDVVVRDIIT